MRKYLFVAFFLILAAGIASAGTYTVKWVNVTSVNDTLNLNFVSTVSNATLTIDYPFLAWKYVDTFPLDAATTEPAQYCIQINGNWINITNSTGYLKASLYDSNFWTYVNSTGADIRITNQSSQLYFWIQDFNYTSRTATIWVNLTAGSTELDIFYGSLSALPSTIYSSFELTTFPFTQVGTISYSNIAHSGAYSLNASYTGTENGFACSLTVPSKFEIIEYVYIEGATNAHLVTFLSGTSYIGPHIAIGETGTTATDTQIYYFNGAWVATGYYLTTGEWHEVRCVIDTTTQTFDLYVDGTFVTSGTYIAAMSAGSVATFQADMSASAPTAAPILFDDVYISPIYSDGSKTFPFFDDFTGTALDLKWTVENGYGTYSVTVENSVLTLYANASSVAVNATGFTIDFPAIVYARVKDVNASFSTYARDRFLSSDINNPFAADSGIFTSTAGGTYYLYWQGSWTTTVPKTDTWVISKEIFVPGSKFEWIRPTFDVSTATTLTALNLKYGVGDYGATTGSGEIQFDWIFVASLADPAQFGTPYQTQQNITVTVGTFTTTTNASTIAIPSTVFSSTTPVIIAPSGSARFNATLTFNYAYSSSTTIVDTGTVIEKNFSVNTSGLTATITLNVTFPLRTKSYKLFVTVAPSTTITNETTNSSVITSYILQNNTTYNIDERIGYLIANITGKDELTNSALSTITVNYTSSTGWKSTSGATVSIYGTDIPFQIKTVVIEFSSAGYSSRHYILDTTKLNQSITLYLLADSSSTMITYTVVSGTSTLSHAKVEIYKYIGDNYVLIDSQYTDASGVVAVPLHAFDTYKIVASKQGYDTVTATITVTQATYTIKLGGISLAIPASHRAVVIFKPTQSTLQPGNNTIAVEIVPQGTTVTTATMTVYVNNTPVATVTKSDISTPTTLSTTIPLNQSSSVSVKVTYTQDGQTITTAKNYTVPLATGMWAALLLMNQQLNFPGGKTIGLLAAAFIALAVVAGLAATTNTTARGLGLVGMIVFTMIALPLGAISIGILVIVWVAVVASWIVWRWI